MKKVLILVLVGLICSCKILKTDELLQEKEEASFSNFELVDSTSQLNLKCPNSNKTLPLVNYKKFMTNNAKANLSWENHNLALTILNAKDSVIHKYLFDSAIYDYCEFDFTGPVTDDFEQGVIEGSEHSIYQSPIFNISILHNPIQNGMLEFAIHCDATLLPILTGEISSKEGKTLMQLSNLSMENKIEIQKLTSSDMIYLVVRSNTETISHKILNSN